MIALIQRVRRAEVIVSGERIAKIDAGMLALIGIRKTDTMENARKLQQKLLSYRIFADDHDRMNLNIVDSGGELLLVPQFTLAANTQKGNRPSFDGAMPPKEAEIFFRDFVALVKNAFPQTQTGEFGANMQVELVNDGPVTFWLETYS